MAKNGREKIDESLEYQLSTDVTERNRLARIIFLGPILSLFLFGPVFTFFAFFFYLVSPEYVDIINRFKGNKFLNIIRRFLPLVQIFFLETFGVVGIAISFLIFYIFFFELFS